MKLHLILIVTSLVSGCASNQLYSWGDYDGLLYRQYKDATKTEEMRTKLEAHVAQLEKNKQKVPPGIYAELGTLYLQANDRQRSIEYYEREQKTWPESAGFMKAMTTTLAAREVGSSTAGSAK